MKHHNADVPRQDYVNRLSFQELIIIRWVHGHLCAHHYDEKELEDRGEDRVGMDFLPLHLHDVKHPFCFSLLFPSESSFSPWILINSWLWFNLGVNNFIDLSLKSLKLFFLFDKLPCYWVEVFSDKFILDFTEKSQGENIWAQLQSITQSQVSVAESPRSFIVG